MDLEQTPFFDEVVDIGLNGFKEPIYGWQAVIRANDKEVYTYQVTELNIKRDYINTYSDQITVSVSVLLGDLVFDLLPYRDKLEVTLLKVSLFNATIDKRFTYKAVLNGIPDLKAPVQSKNIPTQETMNLTGPQVITLSLARKSVLSVRGMTVGVTYRKCTPGDALHNILTAASHQADTSKEDEIEGVDMDTPDVITPLEHVIIPQPTDLVDVPGYLQKKAGGIYNNGIAFYLQGKYWKVFAPFNIKRFNNSENTLTIYKIPTKRYETIDTTYRIRGGNLSVLCKGEVHKPDNSDVQQLNDGVGVRYLDASKVMGESVEIKENKVMLSRGDIVNEFSNTDREDGLNAAFTSSNIITANTAAERSKMSERRGSTIQVTWDHSDPDRITPGMSVRFLVLDGRELKEYIGTVMCTDSQYALLGTGATARRHKCATAIYIYYDAIEQRD